ncbi:hypothetical protein IGI04_021311 [Brassica rapa subsp. trilocularis]|uniref:PiggyBac transposable element-derived protein domain-containing protein n=1 Tax=Brassica rapa subsp. trilocularis TaxID=1813537 RepID=A0ABQ7M060_BRACM|nr:hypothetical protein IGI04_021311 [Brassica rapa subsp. trilocularis]
MSKWITESKPLSIKCIGQKHRNQSTYNHHSKGDYAMRGKKTKDEVQIYTWKDANLSELTYFVCLYTMYVPIYCKHSKVKPWFCSRNERSHGSC